MGPPSYMRSVIDRNVVMWRRMTVLLNVWVWDNKILIQAGLATWHCSSVCLHTVHHQSPIPYINSSTTSEMLMFLSEIVKSVPWQNILQQVNNMWCYLARIFTRFTTRTYEAVMQDEKWTKSRLSQFFLTFSWRNDGKLYFPQSCLNLHAPFWKC